jgi:chromosome segregation ATPase
MDNLLAPLLTAIVAAVSAAVLLREQRRKLGAEADSLVVSAADHIIKNLRDELSRLGEQVNELEADYQKLRADHEALVRLLHETQGQLETSQAENRSLRAGNTTWKNRVRALEYELDKLRAELALPPPPHPRRAEG